MFISAKKFKELEDQITKLTTQVSILQNNEVEKLRKDSKELQEIKELLKSVKIKVQSIRCYEDTVKINYEVPSVIIEFNNGVQINKNEFLRATNLLNIVGFEDQSKIAKELAQAKERSKI